MSFLEVQLSSKLQDITWNFAHSGRKIENGIKFSNMAYIAPYYAAQIDFMAVNGLQWPY